MSRTRGAAIRGGRGLLALLLCGWLAACGSGEESEPTASQQGPAAALPLNVLLVTIDTLRADALGAYDPARVGTSPHIDRLAAEGVLFEQVVTSAPSTLPSHATILTGQQPYVHGVRSNAGYRLSPDRVTLAEILRDAGYDTAAEVAAAVIGRHTGLDQGFAVYRDTNAYDVELKTVQSVGDAGDPRQLRLPERTAQDIARHGIAFLRKHRERPFFLWLHFFDPHVPYVQPEGLRGRFRDSPYHGEVAFTDEQIGLVVAEIERLGLAERTLLVLTSDHGEGLGEHGEPTHSFYVYDSTMRVPLILWGPPDLVPGRRVENLVRTEDVAPTVLDWVGLSAAPDMQGVSLRSLATGGFGVAELTGYGESIEFLASFGLPVTRFVREGRWKYIHKVEPELYDVVQDPHELHDRAASEPEVVARLQARLRELLSAATDSREGEIELTPELREQLNALGYVANESRVRIGDELSTLELFGPELGQVMQDADRYEEAWGKILYGERFAEAEQDFRALVQRYPTSTPALHGLARALLEQDRGDEALEQLERVLELAPGDLAARETLMQELAEQGRDARAERVAREGLALEPCHERLRVSLGQLLVRQGRHADQLQLMREGIAACPSSLGFRNDYAYTLASCPEASCRDAVESLRIARELVQGAGASRPALLDTLAAAYAENGRFEEAVQTLERALALARQREHESLVAYLEGHLETVRAGQPIRE